MNIPTIAAEWIGKVKESIQTWIDSKIDEVFSNAVIRRNAKRFAHNWIEDKDYEINMWLDKVRLFGLDKDGNIDTDLIIDEVCELGKEIDYTTEIMGYTIEISGGKISLMIPDTFVNNLIFGNKECIRMNIDEIKELKELML